MAENKKQMKTNGGQGWYETEAETKIEVARMRQSWRKCEWDRQLVNFLLHELLSVRANTNRMENVSLPFYTLLHTFAIKFYL